MAIPNTNTFTAQCVCTELQLNNGVQVKCLSAFFTCAPNSSYDSSYKGGEDRLSNFRNYILFSGKTIGTYLCPQGVATDSSGNVWTANYSGNSVSKVAMPSWAVTTYPCNLLCNPYGIASDGTNMWVTNYSHNSIVKVTPTGVMTQYTGGTLMNGSTSIAYDNVNGNMWTANFQGNSVSKITPAGVVTNYGASGNPVISHLMVWVTCGLQILLEIQ